MIRSGLFLVLALICGTSSGFAQEGSEEAAESEEPQGRGARRQLFSEDELDSMWDKARLDALERARVLREERSLFGDVDGDIVDLEPFTVRGDSVKLFADFKRRLEEGSESIQRRAAELDPILAGRARMTARAGEAFFKDRGGHGPMDRPEVFLLTDKDMSRIGGGVLRALGGLFGVERGN